MKFSNSFHDFFAFLEKISKFLAFCKASHLAYYSAESWIPKRSNFFSYCFTHLAKVFWYLWQRWIESQPLSRHISKLAFVYFSEWAEEESVNCVRIEMRQSKIHLTLWRFLRSANGGETFLLNTWKFLMNWIKNPWLASKFEFSILNKSFQIQSSYNEIWIFALKYVFLW